MCGSCIWVGAMADGWEVVAEGRLGPRRTSRVSCPGAAVSLRKRHVALSARGCRVSPTIRPSTRRTAQGLPTTCINRSPRGLRSRSHYYMSAVPAGHGARVHSNQGPACSWLAGPDEREEEEGRVAVSDGPVRDGGHSAAATSNASGSGHVLRGAVGAEPLTANGGASRGTAEANGHTALAAAAGSSSGGVDQGAGSAVGEAGQGASELGAAAAASGGSAVGTAERADQRALSPGGANPTASSNGAVQVEAAGSCGEPGAAATAGTGALAAYQGPGSAGPVSGAAEGVDPTFESVEAFRCATGRAAAQSSSVAACQNDLALDWARCEVRPRGQRTVRWAGARGANAVLGRAGCAAWCRVPCCCS